MSTRGNNIENIGVENFSVETEELAWVYLNRVIEGPSRRLAAFLEERSAAEMAHAIYHRAEWLGPLLDQTASRYDWLRQRADLAAAEACGARLIHAGHEEWPGETFASAFGFYSAAAQAGDAAGPAAFNADAIAPHALWVTGEPLGPLADQAVAMVGTRAISRYGWDATRLLTRGMAEHQWTIVSGGALGVDSAAHETALEFGGKTIAVLASGIDVPYPARNAGLFERIANSGSVISEYAPGTTPQRHRFLTRNRLVAALSQGVVCVEAAFRSGALNTMNWAEALGRVAMAVPGPITGSGSIGCHQRIRDGRAQLVTSDEGIRELVGKIGTADEEAQLELDFAPKLSQTLSRNELKVYGATPLYDPAYAEDIAREAGLRFPLTIHLLVTLEAKGAVLRREGGWLRVEE